VLLGIGGCALKPAIGDTDLPATIGASTQGPTYAYRPLDPLEAKLENNGVEVTNCRILDLLPDETMRLAVGQVDLSGNVSYGVAKAGAERQRYVVVLDYIKSTTSSIKRPSSQEADAGPAFVPTYVGIGLRLTANLVVTKGNVDLGNLIAIGAAAQENRVSGTLVIQTLGISGSAVVLPIPSDISVSSIQNALVAIGTIRSKIYDSATEISPRVVGTYDVFGSNTKAFDAYFAEVMQSPPTLTQRIHSQRCK
jgi:hypothetical protein